MTVVDHQGPVLAPDGGWGWMVTFSSFMLNMILDGVFFTYGIFFPEFLRYFGQSNGKTQLLHSVLVGTCLVSGPLASVLVRKFDSRKVAATGALTASIGFFLSSFAPNLDVMFVCYGIMGGFGFGMFYLPAIVTIGVYFDSRRALATGLALCGSGVGALVFAPITRLLLETYGWRGSMWIVSAITLNGVIFSTTYRPLKTEKEIKNNKHNTSNNYTSRTDHDSESCCKHFCLAMTDMFDFSLLTSPTMLLYSTSCLLVMFGFFIPSNFLPVYATEINLSSEDGAVLILAMGISNTVGRVVMGYITDQSYANSLVINNIALLIGGLATCSVPFYTSFGMLVTYAVVFGLVTAAFALLRSILMAELLGVHRLNSSFGLLGLSMGLSTFVGSPIAGALADIYGNYRVAFYFSGISLVLGGLISVPLRFISKREHSKIKEFNFVDTYNSDQRKKTTDIEIVYFKKTITISTISEKI
ncbi:monocarboxylate transporter 12-like [Argopecten irradians]|uniref:monocarboxylate transporter 12-like n=1 Tax=Argopecten irradians TaxID=31199 RepID=UPI003716B3EC